MSEESIIRRLNRAKKREIARRREEGANILPSDNSIACAIFDYTTHQDMVRIAIDRIKQGDIDRMRELNKQPHQARQIACYYFGIKKRSLIELINDNKVKILYHPFKPQLNKKTFLIPEFLEKF